MVVVEKMELVSLGGDGERMYFFSSSGNNDLKCKRFDELNSKTKQCEMVLRMCNLILFNNKWDTCLLEMNM
jgi:hypothetical protein